MKRMNRTIGMMCLAALLAVGATSCKKNNTEKTASFTFELPALEGNPFADDERGYVDITDGNQLKWWEGDQMMVYSVDATNTTPETAVYTAASGSQGTHVATFSGDMLDKGSYGYFAFYPAEKAGQVTEGNRAYFNVSDTQNYDAALQFSGAYAGRAYMDPKSAVLATSVGSLSSGFVGLRHIYGFANVRLKGNTNGKLVKKITITDNELNLTGEMSIKIPEITDERLGALQTLGDKFLDGTIDETNYWAQLTSTLRAMGYESNGDGRSVTLDCSAANGIEITNSYKCFFIPLRPGALLKGFKVTVTYTNNETKEFTFANTADKRYIMRPGMITNINCIY